jgi:HD-GYP domain-containing protein (c-di-GMP phosphodiesterase class II)
MADKTLPPVTKLYVTLLVVAGIAGTFLASNIALFRPPDIALLIYFLCAVGFARLNVKVPYTDVHFSVDTPFVFVILITYGIYPALIADAGAKLIMSLFEVKNERIFKVPFNIASGIVSVFGAGLVFHSLYFGTSGTSSEYILPIVGMTLSYYLINTLTVATAICVTEKQNLVVFWFKNFLPPGVGFMASGSIATLIFILHSTASYLGLVVIVPLVLLIYYSQKVYLQKETDATKYITDLESLHLSSIQSLSLALDAKDEYTHGHVHRVSSYAVALAIRLGVTDETQLKGIAFAGLVHDIGKIAIPDAILNKPGKYTEAESNRMKIHPIISSEILKSIPLPFPVAKIVRHHHEKWNGKGYPDGLLDVSIPFESRILAVADVWDAIRSDRPYRPKMERERAISIMKSERNETLDAKMTDIFLKYLSELETSMEHEAAQIEGSAIQDIVKASFLTYSQEEPANDLAATQQKQSQREVQLFNGLFFLFSKGETLPEKFQELSSTIAELIPYSAIVFYLPDEEEKFLYPVLVYGNDAEFLQVNSMKIGSGVSGWVYSNQTPMVSTPPLSEFSSVGRESTPYKSVLSLPLVAMQSPVGTVTLYSENSGAFSAEDQDLLVKMGPIAGPLIKSILSLDDDDKNKSKKRKILQFHPAINKE